MNTTTAAGPVSIEGYQRTRKLPKRAQSTLLVALSHFGRRRSDQPISSAASPNAGSAGATATSIWLSSPRRDCPADAPRARRQLCQLDRIDYIDHTVALMERERVRPVRPTLEEMQRYLAGAPFVISLRHSRTTLFSSDGRT